MEWFDFVLERYNYWIVIILMMTGLYIVFARGNLVKKIVGLNLFQTSVFIYYLTIGKIAGGTAPIYVGGELDHGGGHGEEAPGHDAPGHDAPQGSDASLHETPEGASDHVNDLFGGEAGSDKIANDFASNDLKETLKDFQAQGAAAPTGGEASLHTPPEGVDGKIANDAFQNIKKPESIEFSIGDGHEAGANSLADAVHQASEVIYTNPLPHVLILTAIVVGVATTAVGLALAVRIREAYGTIEEDELEVIDNVAEFGEEARARAEGAAS